MVVCYLDLDLAMQIVIHLGAHKTASTYLQKCLAQSERRLTRAKVKFVGPKRLRPMLQEAVQRGTGPEADRKRDALAWLIDGTEETGCNRLILSDEQFLGSLRDTICGGDFYQDAQDHLDPLMRALAGRPATVLLAARDYGTFFASAYGQVVRGWRFVPFDDRLRRSLLDYRRGWSDLTADITALMPMGSRLFLWRYEDFAGVEDACFDLLAGDIGSRVRRLIARPLPGPSQAAIDFLAASAAHSTMPDQDTVHAALDQAAKTMGYPPFNPWSVEERAYLTDRYRHDLIWTQTQWTCERLHPGVSVAA